MIKQPKQKADDPFYNHQRQQIDKLNKEIFANIELTADENQVLIWLCGQDEYTVKNLVSAFRKAKRL